ncbi:hypothetical protein [Actinospica robiniae]|nr:hypothetical protein [Actinospica robiniae]
MHATGNNGVSASYTFNGSGIIVLSEPNNDEGNVAVCVDGS